MHQCTDISAGSVNGSGRLVIELVSEHGSGLATHGSVLAAWVASSRLAQGLPSGDSRRGLPL